MGYLHDRGHCWRWAACFPRGGAYELSVSRGDWPYRMLLRWMPRALPGVGRSGTARSINRKSDGGSASQAGRRGESLARTSGATTVPSRLIALVALFVVVSIHFATSASAATPPPPAGGYFPDTKGVGSFASLPSDSQAAGMVHRSTWEPRPENHTANRTVPPPDFATAGYSGMQNHAQLFGRVTGNFTGTTDEIIQWAAAKWGLPDDLIRAAVVQESNWYQDLKDANGNPITGRGYGDFGHCGGSPAPSGYGANGPASFGIIQIKWCASKDANAPGYGTWPWSEKATAYNLDFYGAIIRGCIEGWDSWLSNGYRAGDLWGCVGRWYSGQWYSAAAVDYIARVKQIYNAKPWRAWSDSGSSVPDTTVPTAPQNLSAAVKSYSQINLSWSASSDNAGVAGYEVYRNGLKIATTALTNYSVTGLTASTTYSFYVIARDRANNGSPASNTVSATTASASNADTIVPTVTITSPAQNAGIRNRVSIQAAAADNVGVVKMELYIDGERKAISTTDAISFTWKSKSATKGPHEIAVTARDAAGNIGKQTRVVHR
jgi:hypothetical protein